MKPFLGLLLICVAADAMSVKRVLVTGANKGIGRAIVEAILAQTECEVLLAARSAKLGEATVEQILANAEYEGRVSFLQLDVTDGDSVAAAAEHVAGLAPLYGVINNAGIGFGKGFAATLDTNLLGAKRVCEAFMPLLSSPGGRIVNIASASGPMFVSGADGPTRDVLCDPQVEWASVEALLARYMALTDYEDSAYGLSKACLNAYTRILARESPALCINSCTPGYILTDLTRGMGATKPPSKGTKAALYCLTGELEGNGRYYGSDAVRSPIDRYRGPGDPPYVGP